MRTALVLLLLLMLAGAVQAQTPTPNEYIYATLTGGQMTRFDYSTTASDVYTAAILTGLLVSLWGMFFIGVFIVRKDRK
jgi:protein-S-isoprenylcysteine O-methyltransferase Ste14